MTFKSKGSLDDGSVFDVGEYEVKIGGGEAPEGIDQGKTVMIQRLLRLWLK